MMCHLDKTSCSRYNTAAHFGVDAGFAAAAVQKHFGVDAGSVAAAVAAAGDEKNVTWNVWEGGGEKYERHSETSSRLCNSSTGVLCLNSDVADRGLSSSFLMPFPRAYEYPRAPRFPLAPWVRIRLVYLLRQPSRSTHLK